jgi:hypothetical protein
MSEPGSNNMILMIWLSLAFAGLAVVGSLVMLIVLLNAYAPLPSLATCLPLALSWSVNPLTLMWPNPAARMIDSFCHRQAKSISSTREAS